MRRFLGVSAVLAIAIAGFGAGPAAAETPLCVGSFSQKTLFSDQGSMESVTVGGGGSLYVSGVDLDGTGSAIYSYTHRGPKKDRITSGPDGPGGLAWSGRDLLWGYGNLLTTGITGDLDPMAGLNRVNLRSGRKTLISDHLGMANGIARGKDGSIFASNAAGTKLDRITPDGETENGWATLQGANGLAVGKNGRYLFANQMTVTPSSIAKIDTRDPSKVHTYFVNPDGTNVFFDGLARDDKNNLYAAVFSRGEVWKITPEREACVVASGLSQTSAVAISFAKKGYRWGNLYAVGFDGNIVQVKNAVAARVPD